MTKPGLLLGEEVVAEPGLELVDELGSRVRAPTSCLGSGDGLGVSMGEPFRTGTRRRRSGFQSATDWSMRLDSD